MMNSLNTIEVDRYVHSNVKSANDKTTQDSSSFFETITRLIMGQSLNKSATADPHQDKKKDGQANGSNNSTQHTVPVIAPSRACRAPPSRRFAHPCSCSQLNNNSHKSHLHNGNATRTLPAAAYTIPLYLYDPVSKKCLPTSRSRDMLLKECRTSVASPYPLPHQLYHGAPCVYDDLVCDARRNRCICKPSMHLFYESNHSAFGCVPLNVDRAPGCRSGQVYNVISKECQKIFDVNELPPSQTTGVSATQFSFVTIVLIWILLLVLIVTAKLRKLRTSNMYQSSPSTERRLHRSSSYRPQTHGSASAWLHPFIAAVNGHHHMNQHRTTVDRHSRTVDDSGNYTDHDYFLATGGQRRLNELLADGTFAGSQLSLNNPPPKFEEIYPSVPAEEQEQVSMIQPPANEDLPTYDEAMKLQITSSSSPQPPPPPPPPPSAGQPPDNNQKE